MTPICTLTCRLGSSSDVFQKTLKHTRYGRISVKCYYDAPEQRLTVELLHAADIIALDANGKRAARYRYRFSCVDVESALTRSAPPQA